MAHTEITFHYIKNIFQFINKSVAEKKNTRIMMENVAKFIVAKFVLVMLVSTTRGQTVFDVTKEGAKIGADINPVITCLMQSKICLDNS